MKIYNEITIDIDGSILYEDSYEYNGPIAELKGGGPSGVVAFPEYQELVHKDWLSGGADSADRPEDMVGQSVAEVMASAMLQVGDNVLLNSTFKDSSSWVGFGTGGWTWSGGQLSADHSAGTAGSLTQAVLTPGEFYQVTWTIKTLAAGEMNIGLGNPIAANFDFLTASQVGNYSFVGKANATGFIIFCGTAFDGLITEVECKKITPASPYAPLVAYDPSTLMDALQTRYDTFDSDVAALDEETDWNDKVTQALTRRTSTEFPAINIDTRLVTINAAAVAAAKLAASSAIEDAKIDLTSIVNQAMLELDSDVTTVVNSAVAAAKNAVDNAVIQDMVDQFELRQKSKHFRTINRFAGGMADANAINSSAFIFGLGQLEGDFNRDVADFDKELAQKIYTDSLNNFINLISQTFQSYLTSLTAVAGAQLSSETTLARTHIAAQIDTDNQIERVKQEFFMRSVSEMGIALGRRVDFENAAVATLTDMNRIRVTAFKEQQDVDTNLDVNDALWDLKVYQYGANMLGSIGGGSAFIPELPSSTSSAIGGAFSGAKGGAAIGTAIAPGIGTAIGAGAGALLGAFGGAA